MSLYVDQHKQRLKWNIMAAPDAIRPFGSVLNLTNGLQHGEFHVGPKLPSISPSPVKNICEYIARRAEDEQFVTLKILSLTPEGDDYQGKLLLHNEHSILSLLQDQVGVVHHHGLFRNGTNVILVLDCLYQHEDDSSGQHKDYINLQQYVIKEKRLPEKEALQLFYFLVNIVKEIHEKKIVHRDLKLGNVVINKRTQEVILTNFALGKHLVRDDDLLSDQRGSLAYVSPDVLSGEPYHGKPSDMWSLGVLLYTMICGQFPFYDNVPHELFKKIRIGKFSLPRDVSMETTFLLKQLIELDPRKRLSASSAVDATQSILSRLSFTLVHEPVQIVPEVDSSQSSECVVPDQDSSTNQQSSVNVSELTAPRLHLYPFIESNDSMWVQSPTVLQHSPISPTSVPLFLFPDSSWTHNALSLSPISSYSYNSSQSLPVSLQVHSSSLLEQQPEMTNSYSPNNTSHLQASTNNHRHSFSEGDPSSNIWLRRLLTATPTSVSHGRRSLGSMGTGPELVTRSRRNSHSSYSLSILGGDGSRTRRRSHEPRDSEREILQRLQATNINGRSHTMDTN